MTLPPLVQCHNWGPRKVVRNSTPGTPPAERFVVTGTPVRHTAGCACCRGQAWTIPQRRFRWWHFLRYPCPRYRHWHGGPMSVVLAANWPRAGRGDAA